MFLEISRNILGKWGAVVLDFYLAHQVILNLIIIAYGITMIIIRRTRKKKAKEISQQKENKE